LREESTFQCNPKPQTIVSTSILLLLVFIVICFSAWYWITRPIDREASLIGIHLVDRDLSGIDLSNASLVEVDLTDSDLSGAPANEQAKTSDGTMPPDN